MSENLKIWNTLGKTDPKHTKKFSRAGGFKGTSVKPIYMTLRMTETFGPAGRGWGMEKPSFDVVSAGDETLVYCTVGVWHGDKTNVVYGVGGDKVSVVRNNGNVFHDDEAFKKAYTDALSNAMKQIGMAADVHMGQHDDDKYVAALEKEMGGQPTPTREPNYGEKPLPSGSFNKTGARAAMQELAKLIHDDDATPDEQTLDAHLKDHKDLLNQVMRDWPEWLYGIEGNQDFVGFEQRVKERRDTLRQYEADGMKPEPQAAE